MLDERIVYEATNEVVNVPPHALSAEAAETPVEQRGLVFVPVPEDKRVKNRLHIDLAPRADDVRDAEFARLVESGATRVDVSQGPHVGWVVLADPEGNEFCVLSPRDWPALTELTAEASRGTDEEPPGWARDVNRCPTHRQNRAVGDVSRGTWVRHADAARPEAPRGYHRAMAEYQITYWRELPSLVVVRDGDDVTKSPLPGRFQEAIDEAAMRLGDVSSDAYLAGWARGDWTPADGSTSSVADDVVARLDAQWSPDRVDSFLDGLRPAADSSPSPGSAGGA
jgi:hypothetical protein